MSDARRLAGLKKRWSRVPSDHWKADDSGGLYMKGTGGQLMGDDAKRNATLIAQAPDDVAFLLGLLEGSAK